MKLKISDILIEAIDLNDIEWGYASEDEMNPPQNKCSECGQLVDEDETESCEYHDLYGLCESCYEEHMQQEHNYCDTCGRDLVDDDIYNCEYCGDGKIFCQACYNQHMINDHILCYNCEDILDDVPRYTCQICDSGPFCRECIGDHGDEHRHHAQ